MASMINTNIASLNSQNNLTKSQGALTTSLQRLSTGLRINSAKDDSAGLAISERMGSQINGLNQATRNSNDGISMSQTAEGALSSISDSLQRIRELAVQSANGTNTDADRTSLDQEFGELSKEIQRVVSGTTFNGKKVVGADAGVTTTFQIGANTTAGEDTIDVMITNMSADVSITAVAGTDTAGLGRATIGDSTVDFNTVINDIDGALNKVNSERAVLGATQSRFEAIISNLQIGIENQSAARSRIMDADFASETANLSRAQVLQQAGNAMVAQANQLPQQVLSLLK